MNQQPINEPIDPGTIPTAKQRIDAALADRYPSVLSFADVEELMERHLAANTVELEWRATKFERERDEARERCREAAQVLIAAIGAAGPEDAEDTARRAAQRIAELEAAAEAAESALEFYCEPTGYRLLADPDDVEPPVIADEGATARDALKALRAALGKEAT